MKGIMTNEEFEEVKREATAELVAYIKDKYPDLHKVHLKKTTGPKRKLDM